eukprot:g4931.t1
MALTPYFGRSFFDEMENMVERAFDRRFSDDLVGVPFRSGASNVCPMDLIEKSDCYVVQADAPGMETSDIRIEVKENRMTITGERSEEKKEENGSFTRFERQQQSFTRTVKLPNDADMDKIEASLNKGVLSVAIPKKEHVESNVKRIEIKGE